ncbi:MAG: Rha family transcriptional regulator [Mangrovibacterium sp.]
MEKQLPGLNGPQVKISSREIAAFAGKKHKNVLRDIRTMEETWVQSLGLKFELILENRELHNGYTTEDPVYMLTKDQCLYVMSKYSDQVRLKLIMRWQELEQKLQEQVLRVPRPLDVYGQRAVSYDHWLLQHGYSVRSGAAYRRIRNNPGHFYRHANGSWYMSEAYGQALLQVREGHKAIEAVKDINPLPRVCQTSIFDQLQNK